MRLFIVTLLNLITLTLFAQSKTEFMVTLRDGNIVTGTAKVTEINLITPYGKLTLPIKNVTSIELGIHTDLTQKEKINTLAGTGDLVTLTNSAGGSSVTYSIVAVGASA